MKIGRFDISREVIEVVVEMEPMVSKENTAKIGGPQNDPKISKDPKI